MSRFLDPVEFVSLPLPMGQRPFELRRRVRYDSDILQRRIVIPRGYRTDLATVPWFFRRVFPQSGRYNNAALVHDWLVDPVDALLTPIPHICDHVAAARVFLEAMIECGVSRWRRQIMFRAVLWFGPRFD